MTQGSYVATGSGEFNRDTDYITTRITADGRDGYPVEPGRYRLIVARACPWANRTIIVRRLLGLEDVLSIGFCGPTHDARSWTFDLDPDGLDPVLKIPRLQDAYFKRDPNYPKGITVPAIVEVATGAVVTNDFAQMTLDFSTEWTAYHREGAPQLYPEPLRAEIDEVAKRIYTEVNNGVYRCGFAGSQEAYDKAYDRLFTALDWLTERLSTQRYLVGDTITEADVRLFTTLARFDPVYHGHFKCNRSKLAEMDVLWAYARDLFQTPGFGDTIDFVQIKQHYYIVHSDINPTQIVPKGPDLSNWLSPHGREALGGRPFGDGTPPGRRPRANVSQRGTARRSRRGRSEAGQAVDEGNEPGALLEDVGRILRRWRRRDRRREQVGAFPVMSRGVGTHVVFEVVGVADAHVPHQVRIRPGWVVRQGLPRAPLEGAVGIGLSGARSQGYRDAAAYQCRGCQPHDHGFHESTLSLHNAGKPRPRKPARGCL